MPLRRPSDAHGFSAREERAVISKLNRQRGLAWSEPSYAEPAGFLGQVLEEFGLPWTSIAVFSGLVLSGFGLSRYFSTAAWMITTVVAFTVVFLFRRQVSGRFALVALLSIATIAVLLGVGFVVAESQATTIKAYLLTYQTLSTVYIGLSIMMPIATMMLSYRRQETVFGGPFPKTVRDAIRRNLVEFRLSSKPISGTNSPSCLLHLRTYGCGKC